MTRDDVRKTFPEATDEQVKTIMDLHGADIERTKGAAGADAAKLTALQNELDEAKTTIGTLEAAKADADKLRARLESKGLRSRQQKSGKVLLVLVNLRGTELDAANLREELQRMKLGKPLLASKKAVSGKSRKTGR